MGIARWPIEHLLGCGSRGAELLLLLLHEAGLGPSRSVAVDQPLCSCAVEPFDSGFKVSFQDLSIWSRVGQSDTDLLDRGAQSRGRRAIAEATLDVLTECLFGIDVVWHLVTSCLATGSAATTVSRRDILSRTLRERTRKHKHWKADTPVCMRGFSDWQVFESGRCGKAHQTPMAQLPWDWTGFRCMNTLD